MQTSVHTFKGDRGNGSPRHNVSMQFRDVSLSVPDMLAIEANLRKHVIHQSRVRWFYGLHADCQNVPVESNV